MMFGCSKRIPVAGAVVLVTGAGSGIGRLMAVECAKRGAKAVIVWDMNEQSGSETVHMIEHQGAAGASYRVDITDTALVESTARAVLDRFGRVDVLINNAGIVTGKDFLKLTERDVARTLDVNTASLFRVTRQFLPQMISRDKGVVMTISSAAGLVGVARQVDYGASKFGALGFMESLRAELRHQHSHVTTLVCCPYYIDTGMFEGVTTKFPLLLPILKPEQVAHAFIDALESGVQMKVMPPFVRVAMVLKAAPVPLLDAALDFFGINSTMDDFVGRKGTKQSK